MTKKETKTEIVEATPDEAHLPVDPVVSMIERVATDPNADIEKLERMLAMKERIDEKAAKEEFNRALAKAQGEMPSVAALHNNDQTRSKYAKLADIYKVCKPIAEKHGFSFNAVPVAGGREGFMNMKWTLRRGSVVESDVSEIPLDDTGMKGTKNKTGTHAYGSTTSYGRRYLFCAVFDIAIGDDDDGQAAGMETVSAEQFVQLRDKLEESGMDPVKFHRAFGHTSPETAALEEFPAKLFDDAMKRLTKFIEMKEKAGD